MYKPNPQQLELQAKKNRTTGEEGELRGLYAHPDNLEAQKLVIIECLNSQGQAEFSAEQKERLRGIRAENWKRKSNININLNPERPDDPDIARRVELDLVHIKAKIARISEGWLRDPKTILDSFISEVPELTIYTMETISLMPKDEPSKFELYFLSQILELPEFLDHKKDDGSLRVMEGIRCLRDKIRTKRFLLGIADAVQTLSKDREEIYMCDAGCGAIPILSVYAALTSPKVKATCIEINPNSAKMARRIIRALNLENRINVIEDNAIKYSPDRTFDLLVSETMHSGLTAEPIVQIMHNLSSHVKPNGITLPSRIVVKAAQISLEDYAAPKGFVKIYGSLHHYVEPEWTDIAQYQPGDNLERISFTLPIPADIASSKKTIGHFVLLASEVNIGNHHLGVYDSLITMPQVLKEPNSDPKLFLSGKTLVNVEYKPGDNLERIISF